MAQDSNVTTETASEQVAVHAEDYARFTRLFKIGAIVCFIVGIGWMMIVKSYW